METSIKYAALIIFLIAVFAIVWTLKDGFSIGRGRGAGPVIEGAKPAQPAVWLRELATADSKASSQPAG